MSVEEKWQLEDEIERLRNDLEVVKKERAELLAALRFYGYDGNWNSSEMDGDGGECARAAITKAEKRDE